MSKKVWNWESHKVQWNKNFKIVTTMKWQSIYNLQHISICQHWSHNILRVWKKQVTDMKLNQESCYAVDIALRFSAQLRANYNLHCSTNCKKIFLRGELMHVMTKKLALTFFLRNGQFHNYNLIWLSTDCSAR